MNAEAAPLRIERQFKKLNDYESDCVHPLEKAWANVEETSGSGGRTSERVGWISFTNITDFPNCRGFYRKKWRQRSVGWDNGKNYLCCSFQEMCSNGQRIMTRLLLRLIHARNWATFRSLDTSGHACLSGGAFKCTGGYSVTNDNYSKAF